MAVARDLVWCISILWVVVLVSGHRNYLALASEQCLSAVLTRTFTSPPEILVTQADMFFPAIRASLWTQLGKYKLTAVLISRPGPERIFSR